MQGAADLHSRQCSHWTASYLAKSPSADCLQSTDQGLVNLLAKRRPARTRLQGTLLSHTTHLSTSNASGATLRSPTSLHRQTPCRVDLDYFERRLPSTYSGSENVGITVRHKCRSKCHGIWRQCSHFSQRPAAENSGGNTRECCKTLSSKSSSQERWVASRRSAFQSLLGVVLAVALGAQQAPFTGDTFENVPRSLSSSGDDAPRKRMKPKSAESETCARKCVSTCVRGGAGGPGTEGPLNVRKPLVVFKEGFRSRQYCLSECVEICNILTKD